MMTTALAGLSRTLAAELPSAVPGSVVLIEGWVHRRRALGAVTFLILRDRSGLAQAVVRAPEGARFHVVQRGESLWSIATDRLGEQAGVAQVAREVDRLWQLNEDRIASGNPDLLYAGTRLQLR